MNLGNKTLNNLLSKDAKVSSFAASEIVNSKDISSFKLLVSKSDFLFDYIKNKILKLLIQSSNSANCLNLLDFCSIYSSDFKDFILIPLVKFKNDEIQHKMKEFLTGGNSDEMTYAVEYFCILNDNFVISFAKKFINSDYEPLKISSIKALSKFGEKEEFNNCLNKLNSADEIEKLIAVDFLVNYGDKTAFEPLFNQFLNSYDDFLASNILCLKDFRELIFENKTFETLLLFGSILRGLPENVSFSEILYYVQDDFLNFLLEDNTSFAPLLILYLKFKADICLDDENYSIDLDNNDKKEGLELKKKVDTISLMYNFDEVVKTSLKSSLKLEVLIAVELSSKGKFNIELEELIKKTNDPEIILNALKILKNSNEIKQELIDISLSKIENKNIQAEILNF